MILSIKKQFLHFFFSFKRDLGSFSGRFPENRLLGVLRVFNFFFSTFECFLWKSIQEKYAKLGSSSGKLEEYSGNSKSIQEKSMNLGCSIWEVSRKWSFKSSTVL
jgi:hypothetical protein